MRKSPKTLLLLYVLMAYVILQFIWWAYLIYDLNVELIEFRWLNESVLGKFDRESEVKRQLVMILGEGTVFLILLFIGAFYIRKFILREQKLAKQERNFLLATTHEFNSPIAAVKLNLQTILKRELTPDQMQTVVSGALNSTSRLESLVSNLLIASRIDSGKYNLDISEFNLNVLLTGIKDRNLPMALREGGNILLETKSDITVSADKRAMELVIENLVGNALKYAKGSLIRIDLYRNKRQISIRVSDNGPGINIQEQKNIFKKFYRIENEETRSEKGTGLGLYLAKELVRAQNGELQYFDNKPSGSIFEIVLINKIQ